MYFFYKVHWCALYKRTNGYI